MVYFFIKFLLPENLEMEIHSKGSLGQRLLVQFGLHIY